MDAIILNENKEIVKYISSYASFIWTKRYYSAGEFELYLPLNSEFVDVLRKNYYVTREDDDMIGIIEKIEFATDDVKGNYLTVYGRSAESILSRRIIWNQTNLKGKVEECIRKLITENIINPSITDRKIPNFILGELKGFTETLDMQVTGKNLLEVIEEICKTYDYGFKISFNDNKQFVFDLYKGVDRSYNQTDIPFVVFSPEFDNIIDTLYVYNNSAYKNVALVAGEGEGTARKHQTVGKGSGLGRYEMFVDARDVSSNNGEITDSEYNALLIARGKDSLAENVITEAFSGEVETTLTYVYGRNYFLGDIVSVKTQYGLESAPRIIEIIESQNEQGYKALPTFATWEVA